MKVSSTAMGPERVFPNSENDCPGEGLSLPGAMSWNGVEDGEEMDAGEEEEEEEELTNSGYYYQPLNQEPEGTTVPAEDQQQQQQQPESSHDEQVLQVQHRIQAMGLHLPEAPPPDIHEEDPEGAALQRSRASIPMDQDHVELVKRTMAAVALPSLGVPTWAQEMSDDQWKDVVQHALQSRQAAAAAWRLHRRGNTHAPRGGAQV
ncbi:male-enhanced antigen 1 isoform 1-T2 [Synchiropus picturatus]